jgi:hypothetical protein
MDLQSCSARYWSAFALSVVTGCSSASSPSFSSPQALPPLAGDARVRARTAPGASYTYTGTIVQGTTTGKVTKRTSLSVKLDVLAASGTYGKRAVTIYTGTETDSGEASPVRIDSIDDVASVPSTIRAGSDLTLLASTLKDTTGLRQKLAYGEQNGVVDQTPEIPGARWNNSAAMTATIANAAGSTTDTYAPDGSYAQTAAFDTGGTSLLQSYPDGNAVYAWPYDTVVRNSSVAFSAPMDGSIHIDLLEAEGLPQSAPIATLKAWYPAVPLALASDAAIDDGLVTVPSSCGAAQRFSGRATQLVESKTRVDVVFGQYETQTRTAYVEPAGLVCLSVRDVLETYYGYSTVEFKSAPLSTVVEDETLGLQQARGSAASAGAGIGTLLDDHLRMANARRRLDVALALYHAREKMRSSR